MLWLPIDDYFTLQPWTTALEESIVLLFFLFTLLLFYNQKHYDLEKQVVDVFICITSPKYKILYTLMYMEA